MEVFGIFGTSFGIMGFIFALNALDQAKGLAKDLSEIKLLLKESGLLEEADNQSEN